MTDLTPRTNTESFLAAVVDRLDTVAARLDALVALAEPAAPTAPAPDDIDVLLCAEPAPPALARRRGRSPVAAPAPHQG